MTNSVYVLKNVLTNRYGDVLSFPTDGYAVRVLQERIVETRQHLDDFQLYYVGRIDIETGFLTTAPSSVLVPWNTKAPVETKSGDVKDA